MGSMGKRRGRRTRSDSGGRRRNVEDGFPTFRHNQWTFEGEIERLGQLARSFNRVKRARDARWPVGIARDAVHALVVFLLLAGVGIGLAGLLRAV